jgi:hypothetical protein
MKKYVKKPIPIDAWQIDLLELQPHVDGSYPDWVGSALKEGILEPYFATSMLSIYTPEGKMKASEGDFLVRGPAGEFYSIKKNIFEMTYDEVEV